MDREAKTGRNRLWILRYARVIAVVGVLMFVAGLVYAGVAAFQLGNGEAYWRGNVGIGWMLAEQFAMAAGWCLTGFLALGLSNLLAYTLGIRQTPNWFLRQADKGLYLLCLCRIAGTVFHILMQAAGRLDYAWETLRFSGPMTLFNVSILLALALVLRRALPIIEESRTLV